MQIINFLNNPNIGLFFFINDKIGLVPTQTPEHIIKLFKDVLKVKVFTINFYNSILNNIFINGNNTTLLIPDIVTKEELKILKSTKMKLVIIKSKLNALGNNMIIKGKKAYINPKYNDSVVKQLEENGFKVKKGTIDDKGIVGANIVIFKKKALINPDVKGNEIDDIESFFKIECHPGTVNNRSNIVKGGIIYNKNEVLISKLTTGPEMMEIEGLLK